MQVTGRMEATSVEKQFRRLAIGAGIAVWVGLILLAVGVVFSMGARSARANRSLVDESSAGYQVTPPSNAAAAAEEPTATATHTPVPPPAATATLEPSQPAPPTEAPEPTATPEPAVPTRLVIPALGLDTPVVEVGWHEEVVEGTLLAVWDVADDAAGWHRTSARPGEPENMVFAGHHNMAGEVFRDLVTVPVGALVSVFAGDVEHVYQVSEVQVLPEKGMPLEVRQENGRWIGVTGVEMLTMVTCWPYNNNTHRVVVRALPVG